MTYGKVLYTALALVAGLVLTGLVMAANKTKITPGLESVDVMHRGRLVTIKRQDDPKAVIPETYAWASRRCPPFCVQPIEISPRVDTVGELEVLSFLKKINDGDKMFLVVDSRTPEWVKRGTIPGSVNVPWDRINVDVAGSYEKEPAAETLSGILSEQFGAKLVEGKWDYSHAKTLVLFCNGIWCPQSSINIRTLIKLGYPADKLKWYRGGMQDWVSVGLTTIKP